MKKILVTGGSGFIGTNLILACLKAGHEIVNLDISPPRNSALAGSWVKCDVENVDSLIQIMKNFQPEIIFHLAARTDLDGKSLIDYGSNIAGVRNVINASSNAKSLKKIIFASSRLVCKVGYVPLREDDYCPDTFYGESKVAGEKIIRQLGNEIKCPWIIVRPTSIWGPWFDVPYKNFFLAIASRKYFHPGNLKIKKSFGYVGNTVFQLIKLSGVHGDQLNYQTIYLADYDPIDVRSMAEVISNNFGIGRVLSAPLFLLILIAKLGDSSKKFWQKNPPLTTFRLRNLITPMVYDMQKLAEVIGPLPFSMSMGIKLTCTWLQDEDLKCK